MYRAQRHEVGDDDLLLETDSGGSVGSLHDDNVENWYRKNTKHVILVQQSATEQVLS